MGIFNEIHSRYFYIISEILKAASVGSLHSKDIAGIVAKLGFAETALTLPAKLLNVNGEGYYVLNEESSGYRPVLKGDPPFLLTEYQKRWMRAIVKDKRFLLFIDESQYQLYEELLSNVEPLYDSRHFITVDMANDGDDYESKEYRLIFKSIMQGIQDNKIILITYESGKGNRLSGYFAPYKLEYSIKDDKFRLCGIRVRQGRMRSLYKLNLSRMRSVEIMDNHRPENLASYVRSLRMPLPVEIEITNERNGFERIFTQLSNFERVSEYDENTKRCLMKIYYYEVDEMELLITLLSFGPVIKVIGPEHFKEQLIGRIAKQKQLLTMLDERTSAEGYSVNN
ncbi:WYL domain-containing protein|uniref:WYL domain-containing protein n=1 Tax=Dendrosporobacter quercicolus TaxID=146817 RepID=A0A1G9P3U9_9FIRM|nr:WYL domain-containing protein [Dendrosporobacter quercicolus]NSL47533.1 WYL domain-containing protein [Dendrosporobacter quercicolus DSM 1736]SDL93213.1 WYL domain-containing protein [Dendrosporobacter quercicolus]